jgi:aldehyde dehydrogenase (NAD+)
MLVADRAAILLRVADLIAARVEEIRDVLIEESGSTFGKAMFEVHYCPPLPGMVPGRSRHGRVAAIRT